MKHIILKGALLLLPTLAMAQRIVEPGEANLRTALAEAQPGDVLFLKNGVYERTNAADSGRFIVNKRNITIIGESRDGTIILGTNSGAAAGTPSATLFLNRNFNNFYAENLTIDNSSVNGQQLAFFSENDSVILNNCRILGFQDAHRGDKKRSYFVNCETGGDVDYIYGDGAIMYEYSRIICRKRPGKSGSGYITAPADYKNTTANGTTGAGIVIKHSVIAADSGVKSSTFALGRPWQGNSASVYISCRLGAHIKSVGWEKMGEESYQTTYMGEYKSMDMDGNLVDVSGRISWSKQLTDTSQYTIANFFKGWDPRLKSHSTLRPAPADVRIENDTLLAWNSVSQARGYLLFRNDSLTDYIAYGTTSYSIADFPKASYSLKTVNSYGRPGEMSQVLVVVEPEPEPDPETPTAIFGNNVTIANVYVLNNILYLPENEGVEVYNLLGTKLLSAVGVQQVSLSSLKQGAYIVRVKLDKEGNFTTQKILVQ